MALPSLAADPAQPAIIARPSQLLAEFPQLQSGWDQPSDLPARAACFLAFRQRMSASFQTWFTRVRGQPDNTELEAAVALVFALSEAGGNDYPAAPSEITAPSAADSLSKLLQRFALIPAWQEGSPRLSEIPTWLLPLGAAYLFSGPRLLTTVGQDAAHTRTRLQALRDLTKLARTGRGSAAVQAAIAGYRRAPALSPSWARELWPEYVAARAEFLAAVEPAAETEPLLIPRDGRKLRVGIIADSLAPSGPALSLLPLVARLDPNRFELLIFTFQATDSPVLAHLRSRGADYLHLPCTAPESVQLLQDALLDVAILVTEPAQQEDFSAYLGRQRFAGLQILHDGLQEASGLPEIDLFLCGSAAGSHQPGAQHPRPALLPGIGPIEKSELTTARGADLKRSEFGLTDGQAVLVSFAPLAAISPETQIAWARILAATPGARLILCAGSGAVPTPGWLGRFCAQFDAVLAAQGASSDQLMVFPQVFASHEARKAVLAVADGLLDAFSFSDAEGVLAAVECGVPVVALAVGPRRNRRAAGLLQLGGLDELAPASADAYVAAAVRLGTDAPRRAALRQRWAANGASLLALHDSFGQSEAFGRIMETTFDQIVADRKKFLAGGEALTGPDGATAELALEEARILVGAGVSTEAATRARLMLAAQPAHPEARALLAQALRLEGQHALAADLLLSQINLQPGQAAVWLELALASADASRVGDALSAVKGALQLDPKHLESWLFLGRFNDPIIRPKVAAALRELAPEDPRVRQFLAQWKL